jgi:hypothetical protein
MAVGLPLKTTYADGDVYSASDVNDTNGTINAFVPTGKAAGVNKIINGDYGVWQRGTSFTATNATLYSADRFIGVSDATFTQSRQTFTAGAAPVAGYEGQYFFRNAKSAGGSYFSIDQRIEDVRTFAGQTVTFSFWLKSSAATTIRLRLSQNFGSGGSASVDNTATDFTSTTSWVRYSKTFTLASISGKTIGTSSYLNAAIINVTASAVDLDIWGVQLESGSTATAFQTATGTIQGELAACQRYYQKSYSTETAPATNTTLPGLQFSQGGNVSTASGVGHVTFKSEMRVAPSVTVYSYTSSQTNRVTANDGNDQAANSGNAQYIGTRSFEVANNSGGTITSAFNGFIFHYVASAEL